ncbi:cullin-associated NEDD8-dissociated protein 1-like [Hibiscus syriacus]|uniref:cullin-associated NEDD8-dissociated protein 1-like n=1 Tax=Hibiscus syriacus TaxID=106335 RepID=UPI0019205BCE|nr:cullin-associated NEDD8-dissociated protein 1-like [Hibiscus syriacus]
MSTPWMTTGGVWQLSESFQVLPFILDQIDNKQKKQYLLLHSLKEVIVRQSVDKAEFQDSSVEKILKLLFNHCESEEEGVRNVVAECLGKIALIEPVKLIPALKLRTTSSAALTRATVVIAIKYSIVEWSEKIDVIIYPEIASFLMLIKDQDRVSTLLLITYPNKKKKEKLLCGFLYI